jgi:hypothetical protein
MLSRDRIDLAPRPPPSPIICSTRRQKKTEKDRQVADGGGRGWARSQIIYNRKKAWPGHFSFSHQLLSADTQ